MNAENLFIKTKDKQKKQYVCTAFFEFLQIR